MLSVLPLARRSPSWTMAFRLLMRAPSSIADVISGPRPLRVAGQLAGRGHPRRLSPEQVDDVLLDRLGTLNRYPAEVLSSAGSQGWPGRPTQISQQFASCSCGRMRTHEKAAVLSDRKGPDEKFFVQCI